jgi:hypothetical protein
VLTGPPRSALRSIPEASDTSRSEASADVSGWKPVANRASKRLEASSEQMRARKAEPKHVCCPVDISSSHRAQNGAQAPGEIEVEAANRCPKQKPRPWHMQGPHGKQARSTLSAKAHRQGCCKHHPPETLARQAPTAANHNPPQHRIRQSAQQPSAQAFAGGCTQHEGATFARANYLATVCPIRALQRNRSTLSWQDVSVTR